MSVSKLELEAIVWNLEATTYTIQETRQDLDEDMVVSADVDAIREWLLKQPHLPQTLDDRLLERFLRSCDSSLERSKAALEYFFTARTNCPEAFSDRDPSSPRMQEVFSKMDVLPLVGLTPEGHSCFVIRFLEKDMETFHLSDYAKGIFIFGDLQTREELERVPEGLVVILDATNWNIRLIPKISLTTMKKYFDYCQEAQPVRAREIHIINPMPFIDMVFSVFRPILKSGIFNIVHVHPVGSDSLYRHVPRDILPRELGGHAGTIQDIRDRMKRRLEAERDWLLKDEWVADESKRVGKRNGEINTEMGGSFRTLTFD